MSQSGSLKRADLVIWSRADQSRPAATVEKWVHQCSLKSLKSGLSMTSTECLKGVKVFSFCGIGDPESFLFLLNQLNMAVIELQPFPDHHIYSESEIAQLKTKAMSLGATHLVTTEKDWVKLPKSDREFYSEEREYMNIMSVFFETMDVQSMGIITESYGGNNVSKIIEKGIT